MVVAGDLSNLESSPFSLSQLSMMPVSEKLAIKKKLKTELAQVRSAENVVADCERRLAQKHTEFLIGHVEVQNNCYSVRSLRPGHSLFDSDKQPSLTRENQLVGKKRKSPEAIEKEKVVYVHSDNQFGMLSKKSEARTVLANASKGNNSARLISSGGRGYKMDSNKIRQCAYILKILMEDCDGWPFNQPVDPVELNIPDYFTIIKEPMDLGTIKQKLESRKYSSTAQFAADVTLTFSNAMRYNPPSNYVHIMAKKLDGIFKSKWKLSETKWREASSLSSPHSLNDFQKQRQFVNKETTHANMFSRRSLTPAEKQKLRKDLSNVSARNMPSQLLKFLQKKCSLGLTEDYLELDIDVLKEETLWELHQILKNCFHAKPAEKKCSTPQAEQESHKGTGESRVQPGCAPYKAYIGYTKGISGTSICRRSNSHDQQRTLSSGVDSDRSRFKEHSVGHSTVCDKDYKCAAAAMHENSANLERDDVGDGTLRTTDQPSTATTGEVEPSCEQQLSPTKALRAAMLKSRFADTILKAQQRTLGEKVDPAKLQREREKLEKKQEEEKARIEAQVKAAQAAAQMKAEAEVKMRREREREAARMALQKMEKSVEFDSWDILKELENLGCPVIRYDVPDEVVGCEDKSELQSNFVNPLKQFGLRMKENLDEGIESWISALENGDVEEGEIA